MEVANYICHEKFDSVKMIYDVAVMKVSVLLLKNDKIRKGVSEAQKWRFLHVKIKTVNFLHRNMMTLNYRYHVIITNCTFQIIFGKLPSSISKFPL